MDQSALRRRSSTLGDAPWMATAAVIVPPHSLSLDTRHLPFGGRPQDDDRNRQSQNLRDVSKELGIVLRISERLGDHQGTVRQVCPNGEIQKGSILEGIGCRPD